MLGILLTIIIIILLVLLYFFLILPSLKKHPDIKLLEDLYVAHRGLHNIENKIPENSILSFQKAIENNFAIEIDIHLTADKEVVVFHDDDLKRVCSDERKINDVSLKELKTLFLLNTNQKIPTLKECIETIDGKVPLLIEFKVDKNNWKVLCEKANEVLKNYEGKYFIQSFFPQVLYWYKHNRKDILRGQLNAGHLGDKLYHKIAENFLTNFLARPHFVSFEYIFYNKPIRKFITKLGAFPVGWTFPSQENLAKLKSEFKTYIFENFIPKK